MYVIIKNKNDTLPTDPKERRAAVEAWGHADSLPLKEAAMMRRRIMAHKRLADAAGRQDLVAQDIERMRAIRRNMDKRINS